MTVADGEVLTEWLRDHVVADYRGTVQPAGTVEQRCRDLAIEPPAPDRIERIVRAALHAYDDRFCGEIYGRLPPATRTRLDALLRPAAAEQNVAENAEPDGPVPALLMHLRSDPGGPSVNSLQTELAKLDLVRKIGLPQGLFADARPHEVERYRQRVVAPCGQQQSQAPKRSVSGLAATCTR